MLLVLSTYSCDPYEVGESSSELAALPGLFVPLEPAALVAWLGWPFSASPFGVVLFALSERAFPLGLLRLIGQKVCLILGVGAGQRQFFMGKVIRIDFPTRKKYVLLLTFFQVI